MRGLIACVAVLAGTGLLVYGAGFKKRTVVVESEVTIERKAPPIPPEIIEERIRNGLPPAWEEPSQFIKEKRTDHFVEPEFRLVRDVTVGLLELKDGRLYRLGIGDGPALCPT